jgi:hypothetical protein
MKNFACGAVRDGVRRLPDDLQINSGHGQDHVRHQPDQLRGGGPCKRGIAGVPTNIDSKVLPFDPAQLPQSMHERRHIRLRFGIGRGAVH